MSEQYTYTVTVTVNERQGGMEASDRIAGVCSELQEHRLIESVTANFGGAPNDFQKGKPEE